MRFLIWSAELRRWSLRVRLFLAGSFDLYWHSHHGIGAFIFYFFLSLLGLDHHHRGRAIHRIGQGIQEIPLFFIRDTTFLLAYSSRPRSLCGYDR